MEQGTTISKSYNKGNWFDYNLIENDKNEIVGKILDNSVKEIKRNNERAFNDLSYIDKKSEEKEVKLNLPEISNNFDIQRTKRFSQKVQKWKGVVESLNPNFFTAKVYDLLFDTTYEFGEFELSDVSPEDLNLLSPGSIFYWTVGYFMEDGQISKKSTIRFQRLISLDEEDQKKAADDIDNLYGNLLNN